MTDVLLLDVTPLSLGIETLGGVMTKLIDKNTTIPTKAQQVFSTAENSQTAVTVNVLQGERERARDNKLLGRFDLADIPPAPRGMPQIEVTFDIDANGILNVSAKDKATQREQSIVIRASSGLSEEEIERMVKDAEAHAEDDRKFRELVDIRNQADALIHAAEKSLADLGDEVSEDERKSVEEAIESLKQAVQGDDKEAIEAGTKTLAERSGKLAERVYQKAQAGEARAAGDEGRGGGRRRCRCGVRGSRRRQEIVRWRFFRGRNRSRGPAPSETAEGGAAEVGRTVRDGGEAGGRGEWRSATTTRCSTSSAMSAPMR